MIFKVIILSIVISFCLYSCRQIEATTKSQNHQTNAHGADTTNIAFFPLDTAENVIFKEAQPTELTSRDLLKIERILHKCIDDYNDHQEKRFKKLNEENPDYHFEDNDFIIDLSLYKRQYIAVVNNYGEKEVWINCLCQIHDLDWRKEIILFDDGGGCYFNLKINLTKGKYYEFRVNGVA